MTLSRSAYRKKQLFKLLLAFGLVLSLFSLSGSVGLSSNSPQKTTTEFLWAARQHTYSGSTDYFCKNVPADFSARHYWIRIIEHEALFRYNKIFLARFNQLSSQFKAIKPEIMAIRGFSQSLIYKDELVIA